MWIEAADIATQLGMTTRSFETSRSRAAGKWATFPHPARKGDRWQPTVWRSEDVDRWVRHHERNSRLVAHALTLVPGATVTHPRRDDVADLDCPADDLAGFITAKGRTFAVVVEPTAAYADGTIRAWLTVRPVKVDTRPTVADQLNDAAQVVGLTFTSPELSPGGWTWKVVDFDERLRRLTIHTVDTETPHEAWVGLDERVSIRRTP